MAKVVKGYCVRCKGERELIDGHAVRFPMANGRSRPAYKGVCSVCGAPMFKIMPNANQSLRNKAKKARMGW